MKPRCFPMSLGVGGSSAAGGGFTLIELVVVIVILGILAAVAMPKFLDASREARIATLNSAVGTMQSTCSMVFAKVVATGTSYQAIMNTIVINGKTVTLIYGYPMNGVHLMMVMSLSPEFTLSGSSDFRLTKAPTPANCNIHYNLSSGPGIAPTYTVTTSGC